MKTTIFRGLLLAALALPAGPASVQAAAAAGDLVHRFSLLVGFPEAREGGASGVLIVPGTVLPVDGAEEAGVRRDAARRAEVLADLAEKLRASVRLREVKVQYDQAVPLALDREAKLPPPARGSRVGVRVKLLGFNERLATYRVVFAEAGKPVTDTSLSVPIGRRAVVGGLDGPEAPYLFLVVEPARESEVPRVTAGITPPKLVQKVNPQYTQEAREAKLEGLVQLDVEIGVDGVVRDVKVVKGLGKGLSEAASEAVRQWRFQPALEDGKPAAVRYLLTINFQLDDEEKKP